MFEHLEETNRYDYYFDGCKSINRLEFLRTEMPNIKAIHMVRHPGALFYHDQKYKLTDSPDRMTLWSRYHRRARGFRSFLGPDNYLAVPYEKLVQDPAFFLERVGNFLGMAKVRI